jgi:hypothetical protein
MSKAAARSAMLAGMALGVLGLVLCFTLWRDGGIVLMLVAALVMAGGRWRYNELS